MPILQRYDEWERARASADKHLHPAAFAQSLLNDVAEEVRAKRDGYGPIKQIEIGVCNGVLRVLQRMGVGE
jgi:hypothetical protein